MMTRKTWQDVIYLAKVRCSNLFNILEELWSNLLDEIYDM